MLALNTHIATAQEQTNPNSSEFRDAIFKNAGITVREYLADKPNCKEGESSLGCLRREAIAKIESCSPQIYDLRDKINYLRSVPVYDYSTHPYNIEGLNAVLLQLQNALGATYLIKSLGTPIFQRTYIMIRGYTHFTNPYLPITFSLKPKTIWEYVSPVAVMIHEMVHAATQSSSEYLPREIQSRCVDTYNVAKGCAVVIRGSPAFYSGCDEAGTKEMASYLDGLYRSGKLTFADFMDRETVGLTLSEYFIHWSDDYVSFDKRFHTNELVIAVKKQLDAMNQDFLKLGKD